MCLLLFVFGVDCDCGCVMVAEIAERGPHPFLYSLKVLAFGFAGVSLS